MPSSKLLPGEHIINDQTPDADLHVFAGQKMARGLDLGRRSAPYGAMYGVTAYPKTRRIPRSEWQARIQEKEELKSRISDLITVSKLPTKTQTIDYCWMFATLNCLRVKRKQMGQPDVDLSAASCGARVKNFQNVGGYGGEAVKGLRDYGADETKYWPENSLKRNLLTPASIARAKNYRTDTWWEILPGEEGWEDYISCLLMNDPTSDGHDWWRHQVMGADVVWLDGEVAVRKWNSWGPNYGSNGLFILQGRRARPDDCIVQSSIWAS